MAVTNYIICLLLDFHMKEKACLGAYFCKTARCKKVLWKPCVCRNAQYH